MFDYGCSDRFGLTGQCRVGMRQSLLPWRGHVWAPNAANVGAFAKGRPCGEHDTKEEAHEVLKAIGVPVVTQSGPHGSTSFR